MLAASILKSHRGNMMKKYGILFIGCFFAVACSLPDPIVMAEVV